MLQTGERTRSYGSVFQGKYHLGIKEVMPMQDSGSKCMGRQVEVSWLRARAVL